MDGSPASSASSASTASSATDEDHTSRVSRPPAEPRELNTSLTSGQLEEAQQGETLLPVEEQLTLITDSMSVTSSDQEKLQLLNKNTDLRRLNKELMKLNVDWDQIYHSTTVALQQRLASLEQECSTITQLNSTLLLRIQHEQSKREYHEHTLLQELKKNQHLHDYIRLLENRLPSTDPLTHWTQGTQTSPGVLRPPELDLMELNSKPLGDERVSFGPGPAAPTPAPGPPSRAPASHVSSTTGPKRTPPQVLELQEQLEALRCQTKLLASDYRSEHRDHERMQHENRRLRRREGEMRQQMALLHEQLKVYEDDFQRERSDKQVLQRLLMRKAEGGGAPVLVHRCNNEQQRPHGDRRKAHEEQRGQLPPHPHCPKHCDRRTPPSEYH